MKVNNKNLEKIYKNQIRTNNQKFTILGDFQKNKQMKKLQNYKNINMFKKKRKGK